ncbi:MAG: DUF4159 domain-containing protein [Acidobacteriota bacterium]
MRRLAGLVDLSGKSRLPLAVDAVRWVVWAVACLGGCLLPPTASWAQNPLAQPSDPAGAEEDADRPHELYFSRAAYSSLSWDRPTWGIDFPKADRQFLIGLERLTVIDASGDENPVRLDDPDLRRFPLIYAVEVGYMALDEGERQGLRDYLLAGGFLIVDDFWGTWEWENFEQEISAVLPEYSIVDLPLDHPVLHVFYDISEIVQVPNVHQGRMGGATWERDGYFPALRGISDENGRLMVVINWNSDLGDAWEWAEDPYYPLQFSNFAYQLGVNLIVYGMSH